MANEVEYPDIESRNMASEFEGIKRGDAVRIMTGAYTSFVGVIEAFDAANWMATVRVDLFGRTTSFEIRAMDVEKLPPDYNIDGHQFGLN